MRNDQDDEEYPETPPVRRCGHCGEPLVSQRKRARYCDRRCKELAREARKRAGDRLTTLRGNHPLADASLSELYGKARPPREVTEEPAAVVPDEFGYTDGVLDEPNASWAMRVEMDQETNAIRARYASEINRWTRIYARNPGPAPRLVEIQRKMNAEIAEVERAYYLAEARELAAADQASGRAQARVTKISKLLGHSSISVTSRYLDHLSNDQAVAALDDIELPELEPAKRSVKAAGTLASDEALAALHDKLSGEAS